ncbi:MAG: thiamine pyrophosphate-dependent enzyme [Verrucomicrobia bacterium]|nr:thiamine pyrophosphate-dependent enzyme [Verrucomicrobiota bacterium]MDA1086181.1 thiamine pyrophosphate-dependent enzyme [Verrucomicrobiota bacterium]
MPKTIIVDPQKERARRSIEAPPIPLNQYDRPIETEIETYGADALIGIYSDMLLIREFESMLQAIKTEGSYQGIDYDHKGPAHLSIGQEAAAVGQAFLLDTDDHIFGSHRSHGEILAKGMSAIRKLDDDALQQIMTTYLGGEPLAVVEKEHGGSVRELATDFLVYGALAEIFARRAGVNRGLGGSMHAFFTPFGIYPNNAIVGGSADIATGAALFKRVNRAKGLVIANIGDASMGCGPTWEAMNFAAMGQFTSLWDAEHRGGLPIIFNFMNNFYGMGGQTSGETMAFDVLARVGAGVNPDAMHAERVDGYNPLAVVDAIHRKRRLIEEGVGPVLLETITYRFSGHSPSDASSYRVKEELDLWREVDPIDAFAEALKSAGVLDDDARQSIQESVVATVTKATRLASDLNISPRVDAEHIGDVMFSNRPRERYAEREPDVLIPMNENPRVVAITKKSRAGIVDGKPVSKNKVFQYRDAIFEAVMHRFYTDPTLVAYGEENRDWGGAFACYRGLTESLPYHRLFNSPISEGAIVGTGVGYALEGGRALVELMYCDFMGRAGDEIFNQMAKWQSMSAGVLEMPLVLRVSVGSKYGAQHSQDWTAICNHIPGLKVCFPATPYDAKGLLNAALNGSDPVVFFESQRLYDIGELFEPEVPEGYYEVPMGPPAQRRTGSDITLVTVGATLYRAIEAADTLAEKYGMSADIFDCRTINPLDYDPIVESIKKTGRVVLASDACDRGSVLHTIAANLAQLAFDHLDAPPVVVGSRNWITPAAEMEDAFFPQANWILDAIHERIIPLPGHQLTTNPTLGELSRRSRNGV